MKIKYQIELGNNRFGIYSFSRSLFSHSLLAAEKVYPGFFSSLSLPCLKQRYNIICTHWKQINVNDAEIVYHYSAHGAPWSACGTVTILSDTDRFYCIVFCLNLIVTKQWQNCWVMVHFWKKICVTCERVFEYNHEISGGGGDIA